MYIMIGDNSVVGNHCDSAYTATIESPALTATARASSQQIYNGSGPSVQAYDAHDNSNTNGTVSAVAGPEFSLLPKLAERHPSTGVVMFKRGANNSTLIASDAAYSSGEQGRWSKTYTSTEQYGQMVSHFNNAVAQVNSTLSKQVVMSGIIVGLGTQDQSVDGGGTLFKNEISTFIRNLRADFATRVDGKDMPVIWLQPRLTASGAITAEALTVRTAITDYAATDTQFAIVDQDDIELSSDGLTESANGTITLGERIDTALNPIALPNC
jgi:hypothetical protein